MKRRNFIKNACIGCCALTLTGGILSLLNACKSATVYKALPQGNFVQIPVAEMTDKTTLIVRSKTLDYDILLVKNSNGNYSALQMKCTHRDNPLSLGSNGLYCSLHGSRFDLEGDVVAEPATLPLKKYKTQLKEDYIQITL